MEDIAAHREAPRRPIPQGRWLLAMSWLKLLVPPCLEDSTVAESDSDGTASDADHTITAPGPELARHRRRGPPAPPKKRAPPPPESSGESRAPRRLRLQSLPPLGSATFDADGEVHRARQAGGPS